MAKAIGGFLRLLLLLFLAAKHCQSEDAHVGSAESYGDEEKMVPRDELESDPYTPDDQTLWSPELFDWDDSDLKTNDSLSSNSSTADQNEEETLESSPSEQDLSNTINYSEDPQVEESGCPFEQQPRSWQPHKEPQKSTCQPQMPQQSKCPHNVPHKHSCLSKASIRSDKLNHISMQESKKLGMPGQHDHQPTERYQQERSYPPWWLQEPHLHEYLSKLTHPLAWLYNMAQGLNQQGHPSVWPQETHRGCRTKVTPHQGCQSQTLPYQYFQNPMIPHQNFHPKAPSQEGFYPQESPQGVHPRTSPLLGHWLHQLQGEHHQSQPHHHRQPQAGPWQGPPHHRQPQAGPWQGPPHHHQPQAGPQQGPPHHRQPQAGPQQGPPHHRQPQAGPQQGPPHHRQPQAGPQQGPPHHQHQPQGRPQQGPPHPQPQVEPWQSIGSHLSQGKQHLPQPLQQWAETHYSQPPHQPELKPHGIDPGFQHWPRAEMHTLYQHNQAQENLQNPFQPDQPQPEQSYSHQPQQEYYGHPLPYHQPQTEFDHSLLPHQLLPHGHPSHQPVEPHQFKPQPEQQYGHQAELPAPQSHGNLPESQEVPTFTKKPRYLPKKPPLKARWPVYKPSAHH